MNNGVVVMALFCCLAAVALCGASLATTYWKVTDAVLVDIHEGLFGRFCDLSDCTAKGIVGKYGMMVLLSRCFKSITVIQDSISDLQ